MPFEKVRPRKVSAIAAEQIVEAITNGSFPMGSKLPSEFDLADQMGVSRPTIREALSALQAAGLIESKAGSGSYVRSGTFATTSIGREAVLILENESSCLEIMEAREVLEPPIAAFVAKKGTNEHLAELEQILEEMRLQAKSGEFNPYFAADKAFHFALTEAAGNRLITAAVLPLINTMDQKLYREFTHHYYLKNVSDLEHVVDLHNEILNAIAQRNPEMAFEKMSEHWQRMREIWGA